LPQARQQAPSRCSAPVDAELNTCIERNRESIDYFNREVARYNLMVAYPDGLDEEAMRPPKASPAPTGREL
jgi:hypothetical protein